MKAFHLLTLCMVAVTAAGCGGGSSEPSASITSSSSNTSAAVGVSSSASSTSSSITSSTSSASSSASSSSSAASSSSSVVNQSGTPATLGAPTSTVFNGLRTIQDKSSRTPLHAIPASAGTMPAALNNALPYIPNVKVLARRDALILYFPNVEGAADYRAYAVTNGVSFVDSANGRQPRGAVVACAGYRQHTYRSEVVNGLHTRELLQAIELPGFVNAGNYTIILEANATPCPFVGMYSSTDAQLSMPNNGTTTDAHSKSGGTYKFAAIPIAVYKSFDSMRAQYGNEIINGQGSPIRFDTRMTASGYLGGIVPPNDPTIPSDPRAIARSVFSVTLPFADEGANAPNFDVGPHAIFENFDTNSVVSPAQIGSNPDYAAHNGFRINPLAVLNSKWEFWGRFIQGADTTPGVHYSGGPTLQALKGLQIFTRHGRLYTTFGDADQDVGGTLNFSSLDAPVVTLDNQKYVHSMFRLNSDASHRRYWYWYICGGASSDELFDATAKRYKLRPVVYESTFGPGGNNPSIPTADSIATSEVKDDMPGVAKECLSITEEAYPEQPSLTDGTTRTSAVLRAQIHPANKGHGIIALGNTLSDPPGLAFGQASLGFRFKIDAAGNRIGPVIDPFDQLQPLVHYDFFLRPDRLVVFVNGRQAACVDMTDVNLTMKYAMIGYGDLLYHSALEWMELADGSVNQDAQLYYHQLNTPIANSRIWDAVAHADGIDIPPQFATFDPSLCRKPSNTNVQGHSAN